MTFRLGNMKYSVTAVLLECDSRAQLHAKHILELTNVKGAASTER